MDNVVATILETCRGIENGRDLESVARHMMGEVHELYDEVDNIKWDRPQGPDGVLGESVDVLLCAVDAIYVDNPNITTDQIMEVVVRKLEKWKRLYG